MIEATDKQLWLLWHTLGLSPSCRTSSRNYFVTSPGYDDANNFDLLVDAGLAIRSKAPAFCDADDVIYRATAEGRQLALAKLPAPPPPAKRTNFDAYSAESECYEGFAHFLGINLPRYQQRFEQGSQQYRMVRYPRGSAYREYSRHYSFAQWSPYETLEVAGDWAQTMKDAKASYKQALAEHRARGREKREAA